MALKICIMKKAKVGRLWSVTSCIECKRLFFICNILLQAQKFRGLRKIKKKHFFISSTFKNRGDKLFPFSSESFSFPLKFNSSCSLGPKIQNRIRLNRNCRFGGK